MKKQLLTILAVASVACAQAQSKFGDNKATISGSAVVEMESTNKGILLPRVSLTSTTIWGLAATATTADAGMIVYNTNKAITGSVAYPTTTDSIGVYYWDGLGWRALHFSDWHITGNDDTKASANYSGDYMVQAAGNYLGTRPNATSPTLGVQEQDLQFRTNGIDALRINAKNQHIAMGNSHPGGLAQNADMNFDGSTGNAYARLAIRDTFDFTDITTKTVHTGSATGPYRNFLSFLNLKANNSSMNVQSIQSHLTATGTFNGVNGATMNATYKGGGTISSLVGMQSTTTAEATSGSASIGQLGGGNFPVNVMAGASVTNFLYGSRAQINNYGSIKSVTCTQSRFDSYAGSTITNDITGHDVQINGTNSTIPVPVMGVYIHDLKAGATPTAGTEQYSIYQSGADDINYFAGNTGIGVVPAITTEIKLDVAGQLKVGTKSGASGAPSHIAPAGTIIFQDGNFYGNLDGTAAGWATLNN